ncbi:MAG TPA: exopolyphosphatase [candidate division Zixibacteria bacterium]|jgi:exopolyphosphatase/guanosine-5'-triphosphate,3'-diphosphate pyrophosphatase
MTTSKRKRSSNGGTHAPPGIKFAAVDVGSNGVRLMLARVIGNNGAPVVKKESLIRIPIRLGEDVFSGRPISKQTIRTLSETMRGFQHLITAYEPVDVAACATSAMREARNGPDLVEAIRAESGIDLEIIDGAREAELIAANVYGSSADLDRPLLHLDIGGGSIELTLFDGGERADSRSFRIGTVRLLKNQVADEEWGALKDWLRHLARTHERIIALGSGGSLNKLFRMSRVKEGRPVTYKQLKELARVIASYSYEERILQLSMRPDRADVIVHAGDIVLSVMKWARISKMLVPQVGLADGLIRQLYARHTAATSDAPARA